MEYRMDVLCYQDGRYDGLMCVVDGDPSTKHEARTYVHVFVVYGMLSYQCITSVA